MVSSEQTALPPPPLTHGRLLTLSKMAAGSRCVSVVEVVRSEVVLARWLFLPVHCLNVCFLYLMLLCSSVVEHLSLDKEAAYSNPSMYVALDERIC